MIVIKRGLFKSSVGKLINADINGALNILRKFLNSSKGTSEFSVLQKIIGSGLVFRPVRITGNGIEAKLWSIQGYRTFRYWAEIFRNFRSCCHGIYKYKAQCSEKKKSGWFVNCRCLTYHEHMPVCRRRCAVVSLLHSNVKISFEMQNNSECLSFGFFRGSSDKRFL